MLEQPFHIRVTCTLRSKPHPVHHLTNIDLIELCLPSLVIAVACLHRGDKSQRPAAMAAKARVPS